MTSSPRTKEVVLTEEFLPLRAKILEIAAALDRLERAGGGVGEDDRRQRLLRGIRMLLEERSDRAEQVQLLFSREYEENWRKKFEL